LQTSGADENMGSRFCDGLGKSKGECEHLVEHIDELDSEPVAEVDGSVYHYTTWGAVKGILCENALHFTPLQQQKNDPFEIRSGLKECFSILDAYCNDSVFEGCRFFVEKLKNTLNGSDFARFVPMFLFCTSNSVDDGGLWAKFSHRGDGVCLEFSHSFVQRCCSRGMQSANPSPLVLPVNYDTATLRERVGPIIKTSLTHLDRGFELARPNISEGLELMKRISVILSRSLIPHCAEYKPSEFRSEREVRFLYVAEYGQPSSGVVENESNNSYWRLPLEANDIRAIWLGPLASSDDGDNLEKLLRRCSSSVEVRRSAIPFNAAS